MTISTSLIINQLIEDNKKLKKCIQGDDATNRPKLTDIVLDTLARLEKKLKPE